MDTKDKTLAKLLRLGDLDFGDMLLITGWSRNTLNSVVAKMLERNELTRYFEHGCHSYIYKLTDGAES